MKKQTEILNYIRQKCLSGEKLSIRDIAKQFGTSNRHLATAEELGYIQKVGPKLYKWKVGEVIPVMAKAMKENIADYYKDHRYKKTVTTTAEEGAKKLLLKGDEVVSVTPEAEPIIQDCNFWERMYNDLKARHEGSLKNYDILLEVTNRKESTIEGLRIDNEALKDELDLLKTLDDAGNTVIDNLKSEVNRLNETIRRRDSEIDRLMNELEQQPQPKKKRWDFTLFGLPIFGTYEK